MTQADRDRLVALKKAKDKKITQRQAAQELNITERHVRRLLRALRKQGDAALVHRLRGRESNRRVDGKQRQKAIQILSREVYSGFGPTLASEYLSEQHGIAVSKETVRKWMSQAGLWRPRGRTHRDVHVWRERRERFGELVQWDTSEHDWLEGRGEKIYLVKMIDDATSRIFGRFVRHDSTEENMQVLAEYLARFGRPLEFYTDKASIFHTTPKKNHPLREEPHAPTQIGRALQQLGIGWIAAHSPQAKGRVERSFETAQDRLVKGLRVAGVRTLEQANEYLEQIYIPNWETKFTVVPACADDAHRPLLPEHDLDAILSHVEQRVVTPDYTFRYGGRMYQIARAQIAAGLRGARLHIELRRDGSLQARFNGKYLSVTECVQPVKRQASRQRTAATAPTPTTDAASVAVKRKQWMERFWAKPAPTLTQAIQIANATS